MPTYIVKVKGEFTQTLGVVADNEQEARAKAAQSLGEEINIEPTGQLEVMEIKEMPK